MAIVYLHKRKVDDLVFYVGVGSKDKRAYDKSRRGKFWKDYTSKHEYLVEIIHRDIPLSEAFEIEKSLIALYGRRDLGKGPLVNQTDGGTSGHLNHSDEVIEKMRLAKLGKPSPRKGKTHSIESKQRMGLSRLGKTSIIKGKICINNNTLDKFIDQSELSGYILDGWILGSVHRYKNKGKPAPNRRKVQDLESGNFFQSQKEAANYFKVSEACISKWIKKGKLKLIKK